jgi:hypothetical protein
MIPPEPKHEHRWQPAGVERPISNRPLYVIQSCECGAVQRVPVPEAER